MFGHLNGPLNWSGAIFRRCSSKVSIQKVLLCLFHCKQRQSRVSLECPGLENIPQLPVYRAKLAQNHDAPKAVSATLSVLKWTGATVRSICSTPNVRSFCLCPFHWKLSPSGVSLETPGLENIAQCPANRAKVAENHDARQAVSATLLVLKWSRAIFRPRRSTPSVCFLYLCPVSISLKTKAIRSWVRVPGTGKYLPSFGKSSQNYSKSRWA